MPLSRDQSVVSSHVEALLSKHALLSQQLDNEMKHAAIDDLALRRLKLKKLKIKDEIERIRQAS